MQESGYNIHATKCYTGLGENMDLKSLKSVCTDFGIGQIHINTAISYNFNVEKLITNEEYSINAGALVLSWFYKKYSSKDPSWYTRYNCGTKSTTKRLTCRLYKKLVDRYL